MTSLIFFPENPVIIGIIRHIATYFKLCDTTHLNYTASFVTQKIKNARLFCCLILII